MNDIKTAFDKIDLTNDGYVERSNFAAIVKALGMSEYMNPEAEEDAMKMFNKETEDSKEGFINFKQFSEWYRSSMLWEKHAEMNEEHGK